MIEKRAIISNPFSITKADDYNDHQILQFWVETPSENESEMSVVSPRSAMPVYLFGAKGSGKTHVLRYHSFPLQKIRLEQSSTKMLAGIKDDGYLGIYVRCGGLNSGRFSGKRQTEEKWETIFAYYLELWLTRHLLYVLHQLEEELDPAEVSKIVRDTAGLFDVLLDITEFDFSSLLSIIEDERRHLDIEVNNCVLSGSINVRVKVSPGRLIFGLPKILAKHCSYFRDVMFVYLIDELENFSKYQQRLVNSFVRDRELPTTFRIGARLYGVKTLETLADQEENLPDSEFLRKVLDDEIRRMPSRYATFARRLLDKRLNEAAYGMTVEEDSLENAFAVYDEKWNSDYYLEIVKHAPSRSRPHFKKFTTNLQRTGVRDVDGVCQLLEQFNFPLVEKAAILAFYRKLRDGKDPNKLAEEIGEGIREFLSTTEKSTQSNPLRSIIEHYRTDLTAQLCRENRTRQYYLGLGNFITMSGGLPRALLTIVRSIFDWAIYNGEDPMEKGGISFDSQYRGVREASEWFFSSMRKSGREGSSIQIATERLAQIFRESRFSDLPIECSLNSFSIRQQELTNTASDVLDLCEQRSFINEISGGQKDRNSMEVQIKYQLHPMLCPRWQLPIGRRGTMVLKPEFANAVFDPDQGDNFNTQLSLFRSNRRLSLRPQEDQLF